MHSGRPKTQLGNTKYEGLREVRSQPVHEFEFGFKVRKIGFTNMNWISKLIISVKGVPGPVYLYVNDENFRKKVNKIDAIGRNL